MDVCVCVCVCVCVRVCVCMCVCMCMRACVRCVTNRLHFPTFCQVFTSPQTEDEAATDEDEEANGSKCRQTRQVIFPAMQARGFKKKTPKPGAYPLGSVFACVR